MNAVSASSTGKDVLSALSEETLKEKIIAQGALPRHVAIIMDGNGRWARKHGKRRVTGHRQGVESVREVTEAAAELGVEYLTLYTFSTENWQRPPEEVSALMQLLVHTIRREARTLQKNNIRLTAMGDLGMLPEVCYRELREAIALTKDNTRMTLNLALSYSGRQEILQAVRRIAQDVKAGKIAPESLGEDLFSTYLYTAQMPDPDLLIRTSGEYRISNFMLWQLAYTELYITEIYWPEFRRRQLYEAILDYQHRDRRFGRIREE